MIPRASPSTTVLCSVLLSASALAQSAPAASPEALADPPASSNVRVVPMTPTPIHVTLGALPPPFATPSATKNPTSFPPSASSTVRAPAGFAVNVFADQLTTPRWMVLAPEGDVLVVESSSHRVRRLRDANHDGVAEARDVFAAETNGLNLPFGVAFNATHFFVANTNGVRRYAYRAGQGKVQGTGEQVTTLPGLGYNQHWTRNVRIAPDGQRLFVTVGSQSNVSVEPSPRASVLVMGLDGSNKKVFASGLRNPVGLDFHPVTGEPYVTVNERDGLGDDLVPDFFTRIQQDAFYGWPYAYLSKQNVDPRRAQNGQSENPAMVAKTVTPDVLFQAHSASLGLTFYRGTAFPARYRNGAFAAFRGSWNRSKGTGFKVVFIPFNAQNRPTGVYEDFLTGFLTDPNVPTTWARPVGLLELPDGSLLVTDDNRNRIYRIRWVGTSSTGAPEEGATPADTAPADAKPSTPDAPGKDGDTPSR
ncbi:sorbosone dehydrogenase family protein [Myxococcus sp. K15C18031901]|uniref:PQQ-dependent sugar dehydrogenase n=1 Tax=Myxococcus dinghuensis TaxID=2906761 RepID=UPI0020A77D0F|nr:PQQ-dependent sugar dehydrogenase [Myxococcus dinghuensis]MCP3103061.1 sorbosone dehydrogenase family protein [Myxococcus dinghuensis]